MLLEAYYLTLLKFYDLCHPRLSQESGDDAGEATWVNSCDFLICRWDLAYAVYRQYTLKWQCWRSHGLRATHGYPIFRHTHTHQTTWSMGTSQHLHLLWQWGGDWWVGCPLDIKTPRATTTSIQYRVHILYGLAAFVKTHTEIYRNGRCRYHKSFKFGGLLFIFINPIVW